MNKCLTKILTTIAVCMTAGGASAIPVTWTDWGIVGQNFASGTMGGVGVTVTSTANMNGISQTVGPCTNYWTELDVADRPYTGGTISNAPPACEQIGLNFATTITVDFSSPVTSLYMALLSVGQKSLTVTYDFNQSFVIDSEGQGYWGDDDAGGVVGTGGDTLAMQEFHGVLRFNAPISSLSFTTAPNEFWHAFTFGMPANAVPEPGTFALTASALMVVCLLARRRRLR